MQSKCSHNVPHFLRFFLALYCRWCYTPATQTDALAPRQPRSTAVSADDSDRNATGPVRGNLWLPISVDNLPGGSMTRDFWRYDHLTWPEMKAAIARAPQPVVAIPIGAVEDHGPHTPLSTDNDILEGILAECGRQAEGDLLVLPAIPFGLDEHHMDFPGVITIDIPTVLAYLSQAAISVARHGFTHIFIVNGHGSNQSICDLAARQCVLATGAICAATTVNAAVSPSLVADVLNAERRG